MKTLNKKDILYLFIIWFLFLGMVVFLTGTKYLYGSQLDWYAQHISIPEYFRTLFYDTHDLLPDFALNLGSGQNIYNYSYYGFLSPIILISYLFPGVKMVYYLIIAVILAVLISSVLMYVFLKNKKIRSEICFLAVLMFVLSAPISFHSHRHIMFIVYMPFLILGLFGVEKKVNTGKGWLLSLSVFLTVMTSYYYSVGAILTLIVYAVYYYLKIENEFRWKKFIIFLLKLSLPFAVAILASGILTLPTLAALMGNREETNAAVSIIDILIPNLKFSNLLYEPYGIGLNAIAVPAVINVFKNKKENIFLGIILAFLALFNCFSYILNGMMYIDAKAIIPFLPLYVLVITEFLNDAFEKKIKYRLILIVSVIITISVIISGYKVLVIIADMTVTLLALIIFRYYNKREIIIVPIALFTIASAINTNRVDDLVSKQETLSQREQVQDKINYITDRDEDFYRISNDINISNTPNIVYDNIRYLKSTTYSSISNREYNRFYFDTLNNNMSSRNRALTSATDNIMSLMLMGNKYIVSENKPLLGYDKIYEGDGISIYENTDVLTLGFASSQIMDYKAFEDLSDIAKQEALLNYIIADTDTGCSFSAKAEKIDLDYGKILKNSNVTEEKDGSLTIKTKETLKISYTLPKKYRNKILFIRFRMNYIDSENELVITINNVKNKLTESSWRYFNGNELFDFVLAEENLSKLTFKFKEGKYNLSDFETYILDYEAIENVKDRVDKFINDRSATKGDRIAGSIDVKNDGYFMIQIPYDKGFTIKVDGRETETEKLDGVYVGCRIEKGFHDIEIEYNAPLKQVSMFISLVGIILFLVMTVFEQKCRTNNSPL